jgi:hypothetical protein
MKRAILLFAAVLLVCGTFPVPGQGEGDPAPVPLRPVKLKLEPVELPLSDFKSITAATYIRAGSQSGLPKGYHTLFEGKFGVRRDARGNERGGVPIRFLHQGWDRETCKVYYWPGRGRPIELPRLEKGLSTIYLPFGPLRLRGLPPLTVHFYFPTTNVEAWKRRTSKTMHILNMECLVGEAELCGKKLRIGILDRTLNRQFTDCCQKSLNDGDWFLVDADGDGSFSVSSASAEVRALTKAVHIADAWWRPSLRGKSLVLKPTKVAFAGLKIEGVEKPCQVSGWSYLTGNFKADLDDRNFVEIPKDKYMLYTYSWTKEKWRLSGSIRSLGVRKPGSGGVDRIRVGPTLVGKLQKSGEGRDTKFTFTLKGQGAENVTLYKDGKRVSPYFVVYRADGGEVFRQVCKFG